MRSIHPWFIIESLGAQIRREEALEPPNVTKDKVSSAPQNDRLNFSFVKDIHVVGKKWLKWPKTAIYQ